MKTINDTLHKIFRCLIDVSKPKNGAVTMSRVQLLWKKREYYNSTDHSNDILILPEFLDAAVEVQDIDVG